MNDAQQEMSPDFVLMRLVSDRLENSEAQRTAGCGSVKVGHHGFDPEPSGLVSPHYSSPLPGKRELDAGSPRNPDPQEDFAAAAQRFVEGGSRAQLMVFQNLLRSADQQGVLLEERLLDSEAGSGPGGPPAGPGGGGDFAEETLQPWPLRLSQQDVPGLDPDPGLVLRHRLAQWPPGLLDQALRIGLLEPRKDFSGVEGDPVLVLARRLGQLGEGGGGNAVSRCSCHSEPGGEDPGETSDALLVLEGLGSEGGELGGGGGTLSGLMQQVHRLAEEAGVLAPPQAAADPPSPAAHPQHQSRASTPKLGLATGGRFSPMVVLEGQGGERKARGKSRKGGGSLKVRLSKLFRTKSSSGGAGGLLDKRPSLVSSTSSGGGSLLDVWGSTCSTELNRLQVGLPRAFSPPFTDDFGAPPQQQSPFSVGGSMLSLPPRPLALPTSLSAIQHSLSLNDSFLRGGLPRPVPLRPDGPPPPQLTPRCPLSRPDAGSFASSLRELEKCGWYWGPMNWEDGELKLKGRPDGAFLVRDSSDPRYILSLSFRSQGVTHHTRMEHYRGTFSLWCHPKFEDRCHSVVEFIERAILHSKNGKFLYFLRSRVPGLPPTPVQLLYPVSRFSSVKSLQHLCRFCIRQLVRIDHIQELPLPTPLISYLRKFYYYDPEEEISPTLGERGVQPSRQQGVQLQPGVQQGVQQVVQVQQGDQLQPGIQVLPGVQQGVQQGVQVQPGGQQVVQVQQDFQQAVQVQPGAQPGIQQGVLVQPGFQTET
ncbi:hypothetical protein PBY51_008425 [Eleginops maclovinus]|uniref:Suppressor of cytokine signaling 7 n=1 Tax=Eleginops maclovinus TaxID=56733 RepID=A0AAN8AI37_ELEMC|nr:hypothetical protein PBY51_008425 [Eleginops maclovinus]